MSIQPFELHQPDVLENALDLFARYGSDAAPYAGGTELILTMKMGILNFSHLIDMKRITGLSDITLDDGVLRIGATATHRMIEENSLICQTIPELASVTRQIANIRVRSVGTLAGGLAFSDPHADPAGLLVALGASVEIFASNSSRTLALEDFLIGAYETDLDDKEVIGAIQVPIPLSSVRIAYENFRVLERPVVGAAAVASVEDQSFTGSPRVVLSAIDEVPRQVDAGALSGSSIDDPEAIEHIARLAANAADPVDDLSGSAEYKRHLATVMTRRAIRRLTSERSIS